MQQLWLKHCHVTSSFPPPPLTMQTHPPPPSSNCHNATTTLMVTRVCPAQVSRWSTPPSLLIDMTRCQVASSDGAPDNKQQHRLSFVVFVYLLSTATTITCTTWNLDTTTTASCNTTTQLHHHEQPRGPTTTHLPPHPTSSPPLHTTNMLEFVTLCWCIPVNTKDQ